jgi:hypothetical protein
MSSALVGPGFGTGAVFFPSSALQRARAQSRGWGAPSGYGYGYGTPASASTGGAFVGLGGLLAAVLILSSLEKKH